MVRHIILFQKAGVLFLMEPPILTVFVFPVREPDLMRVIDTQDT